MNTRFRSCKTRYSPNHQQSDLANAIRGSMFSSVEVATELTFPAWKTSKAVLGSSPGILEVGGTTYHAGTTAEVIETGGKDCWAYNKAMIAWVKE